MEALAQTGQNAITQIQTFTWILCGVAIAICGLLFVFGDREMKEHAKKWMKGIVVGVILVMGATSIAELLKSNVTF